MQSQKDWQKMDCIFSIRMCMHLCSGILSYVQCTCKRTRACMCAHVENDCSPNECVQWFRHQPEFSIVNKMCNVYVYLLKSSSQRQCPGKQKIQNYMFRIYKEILDVPSHFIMNWRERERERVKMITILSDSIFFFYCLHYHFMVNSI